MVTVHGNPNTQCPKSGNIQKKDFFVSATWMESITWLVGPFDYLSSIQKVIWILHLFKSGIQMPLKYQISPELGSSQCHSTSCVLIFRSLDSSLAPPKGWSGASRGDVLCVMRLCGMGMEIAAFSCRQANLLPLHFHHTTHTTPSPLHHTTAWPKPNLESQIHSIWSTHLVMLLEKLCCYGLKLCF